MNTLKTIATVWKELMNTAPQKKRKKKVIYKKKEDPKAKQPTSQKNKQKINQQ